MTLPVNWVVFTFLQRTLSVSVNSLKIFDLYCYDLAEILLNFLLKQYSIIVYLVYFVLKKNIIIISFSM